MTPIETQTADAPSFNELLSLVHRAWVAAGGETKAYTTASPIEITTSDGAIVLITVKKQPDAT